MGGLSRYFGGGLDFLWGDDSAPTPEVTDLLQQRLEQEKRDREIEEEVKRQEVEQYQPSFSSVFGGGLSNFLSSAKNAYFPDRTEADIASQKQQVNEVGNLEDPNLFAKQRKAVLDVTGGNVKKVLDIGAGMLSDQNPHYGVDAAKGNEAGQFLFNSIQRELTGNETEGVPLQELSRSENPLVSIPSRFGQTLGEDAGGMVLDPNTYNPSRMIQGLQSGEMLHGLYDQVVNKGVNSVEDIAHTLPLALGAYHFGKAGLEPRPVETRSTVESQGNIPNLEPIQAHAGFDFGDLLNEPLKNLESPEPIESTGDFKKRMEIKNRDSIDAEALRNLTRHPTTERVLNDLAEVHGTENPSRLASGYFHDVFSTDNPDLMLRASNQPFNKGEVPVEWPDSKYVIKPKETVFAGGKQVDVVPALKKIVKPSPEQVRALEAELAKEGKYTLYDPEGSGGNLTVIGGKARVVDPGALIPNEVVKNYEAAKGVPGPEADAARREMHRHIRRAGFDFDEGDTSRKAELSVGGKKEEEPGYKSNFADVEKDLVDSGLMSPSELRQEVSKVHEPEVLPNLDEPVLTTDDIVRRSNEAAKGEIKTYDPREDAYKAKYGEDSLDGLTNLEKDELLGMEDDFAQDDAYAKDHPIDDEFDSPYKNAPPDLANALNWPMDLEDIGGKIINKETVLPENKQKQLTSGNQLPDLDEIYSNLEQRAGIARSELEAKRSGKEVGLNKEVGQQLSAKDKRSLQLTEDKPVKVDELFDPETGEVLGNELPNIEEPKTQQQMIQESLNSIRAESGKSAVKLPASKPSIPLDTDLAGGGNGGKKPPKVTQPPPNQPPGGPENPANPSSERSTFDMITDVPKELKSSLDISFPFRQGLFLLNRPAALKGMGRGLKNFFSEKGHLETRDYLENKWSNRELAKNSGLAQVEYDPTAKTNTSEEFGWQGLGRVPGIKHSERSFIDSGNLVRANMFDEFVKNNPDKSPEFYKGTADYLNTLTGRTPLPKSMAKLSNIANKAMWSPRFVASRVQLLNPAFYAKLPVEIQKAALRDVAGTLAGAAIVSGGIKALGDAQGEDTEIGVDPRQGNFGYVRVGKTSYNLFAGLSPLVKLYSRLVTGQTKDKTDKVTALSGFSPGSALGLNEDKEKAPFGQTVLGEIGRFARGKESPALGTLHNLIEGKDFLGQQYNATDIPASLGLPLSIEDFISAFRQGGLEEALKTLPGIAGVGVQVQKPLAKDKKKTKKKKSSTSSGTAYPSIF